MVKIKHVFLDMDGVIVEFMDAALAQLGFDLDRNKVTYWDYLYQKTGVSKRAFWENFPREFWINLKFTREASDLLTVLERYEPILFTVPTISNAGWKQEWIRKNLPRFFAEGRYMIGPRKEWAAHSRSVLIDDGEHNIGTWREAGGFGILFPRPWNSLRKMEPFAVAWVKDQLEYFERGEVV